METGLIVAAIVVAVLLIGALFERWRVRNSHRRWLRHLQGKQ